MSVNESTFLKIINEKSHCQSTYSHSYSIAIAMSTSSYMLKNIVIFDFSCPAFIFMKSFWGKIMIWAVYHVWFEKHGII